MQPTLAGKILGFLLVLGVLAVGAYVVMTKQKQAAPAPPAPAGAAATQTPDATPRTAGAVPDSDDLLAETRESTARLAEPQPYHPKDNVVDIEISQYAGYAGLIVANNGLQPNENSLFFRNHGFKVRLAISEEESWSALNSGKMAAAPTTVDVLAVYGKQFNVVAPVQIGYSRGADALVVRSDISRVNDLKGKTLVTAQFTEVDFFIRYLAQEAGLSINPLPNLNSAPSPDAINLLFAKEGFGAADLLLKDVKNNWNRLAGCTTWAPRSDEVVEESGGALKVLASNRNLLIVADVLAVNRGFVQNHPKMVEGLVAGILAGNKLVREDPARFADLIEKSFGWEKGDAKAELAKVHLSNLAENLAFFSGEIDTAGSFSGIFASATLAYGSKVVRDPVSADKFMDTALLKALQASGAFPDEKVAIAPVRIGGTASVERNPILSKNIRFLFEPNSAKLDMTDTKNLANLSAIQEMIRVSPGSLLLLRGHVDDGQKSEFAKGGEARLRQGALRAMKLSKDRADEIKRILVERKIADDRIDTIGLGWEEPLGPDSDENRRVEVQWFTLE
jgi:NitT/TauT family transport system substrate-binding protein